MNTHMYSLSVNVKFRGDYIEEKLLTKMTIGLEDKTSYSADH